MRVAQISALELATLNSLTVSLIRVLRVLWLSDCRYWHDFER